MDEYTTSRGVKVKFLGIATLIDALRASGEARRPKPPTYVVKTLGGSEEIHAHDETTLETEEQKKEWAEYKKLLNEWEAASERDMMRLMMLRGVELELPKDNSWEEQQKFIGIEVPQDPMEKRFHYIQTEVLGGVQDYKQMMLGVMQQSGVPEELLRQVAESFRSALGNYAIGTTPDSGATLESERKVRTGGNGV